MKKLFILMLLAAFFTGCAYTPVSENTSVPLEVYNKVKTDTTTVSFYVVTTNDYSYYFNESKELVQKYVIDGSYVAMSLEGFILLLLLIFLMSVLLTIFTK